MNTVEDLRNNYEEVNKRKETTMINHREAVKETIEYWIETKVIPSNRPWRAVIGNTRCKPIPIHRDFSRYKRRNYNNSPMEDSLGFIMWPNFEDEEIKEHIKSLGFVLGNRSKYLAIAVPALEKGKPLTFAQECVKRINDKYSIYVQSEKEIAKSIIPDIIIEIYNTPDEKIYKGNNCTIFEEFVYSKKMSKECARFCEKFLKQEGIVAYYNKEGDELRYIGMVVKDNI